MTTFSARARAVFIVVAVSAGCTKPPAATDVRASGYVEETDLRLASTIGGRVILLNVKVGDRVKANSLVARIAAAGEQIDPPAGAVDDTSVRSPAAGVVIEQLVKVGEVIGPRTPVAVIGNLATASADLFVPEPLDPRLRLGQTAVVFVDASGTGRAGTVSYISAKSERTSTSVPNSAERSKPVFRVRIEIDNKDGMLKRGMPVDALIALEATP